MMGKGSGTGDPEDIQFLEQALGYSLGLTSVTVISSAVTRTNPWEGPGLVEITLRLVGAPNRKTSAREEELEKQVQQLRNAIEEVLND